MGRYLWRWLADGAWWIGQRFERAHLRANRRYNRAALRRGGGSCALPENREDR